MPSFKLERKSFGLCKRCNEKPAFFMPLMICDSCHADWVKLDVFEAGSVERHKAVDLFFENLLVEEIFKQVREKTVVRFSEVEGSKEEMKEQFSQQLTDFEKQAKAGKTVCLTDLLINAEKISEAKA